MTRKHTHTPHRMCYTPSLIKKMDGKTFKKFNSIRSLLIVPAAINSGSSMTVLLWTLQMWSDDSKICPFTTVVHFIFSYGICLCHVVRCSTTQQYQPPPAHHVRRLRGHQQVLHQTLFLLYIIDTVYFMTYLLNCNILLWNNILDIIKIKYRFLNMVSK